MSDSATTPHLPTGSTRTIMIVVLLVCNVLACFLEMLMNIALDHIATQYDIRLSLANWVVLGFAIVNATAITTAASLLRRFGIRKIMLTGCLFALAGSLLGFFATSFPLIVVARLIQAVTTGLFFPVVNEALFTLSPKGKAGILLSANSAVCGFCVRAHAACCWPRVDVWRFEGTVLGACCLCARSGRCLLFHLAQYLRSGEAEDRYPEPCSQLCGAGSIHVRSE